MPELAEVETVRRQLEARMVGHKITEVVSDAADQILFAFEGRRDVIRALTGAKVIGTGRKGKYFWLELNRRPWPIFHLGMSGNVALLDPKMKKNGHAKVWGGARLWQEQDEELRERLWFCRLLLKCDRGFEMALIDPRRFGRIWLTNDPWTHPRIKKLGFDPLLDFPSVSEFGQRLQKRKKSIKSVLLDQSLFAGIGNWLADEILYQAKLSPHHLASDLKPAQVKNLHKQILVVVKKAVLLDADYNRFPKTWLFHHRWAKAEGKSRVDVAKTSRGQKIVFDEIGGRTTAWVPGWQK